MLRYRKFAAIALVIVLILAGALWEGRTVLYADSEDGQQISEQAQGNEKPDNPNKPDKEIKEDNPNKPDKDKEGEAVEDSSPGKSGESNKGGNSDKFDEPGDEPADEPGDEPSPGKSGDSNKGGNSDKSDEPSDEPNDEPGDDSSPGKSGDSNKGGNSDQDIGDEDVPKGPPVDKEVPKGQEVMTPPASGMGVTPVHYDGNDTGYNNICVDLLSQKLPGEGDLGDDYSNLDGTYDLGEGIEIQISTSLLDKNVIVNWEITKGDYVVNKFSIKAANGFNLYDYGEEGATSDTGLYSPKPSISHVVICLSIPEPEEPEEYYSITVTKYVDVLEGSEEPTAFGPFTILLQGEQTTSKVIYADGSSELADYEDEVVFTGLPAGTYTISESFTLDNYTEVSISPTEVTLPTEAEDGSAHVYITNQYYYSEEPEAKGSITFIKAFDEVRVDEETFEVGMYTDGDDQVAGLQAVEVQPTVPKKFTQVTSTTVQGLTIGETYYIIEENNPSGYSFLRFEDVDSMSGNYGLITLTAENPDIEIVVFNDYSSGGGGGGGGGGSGGGGGGGGSSTNGETTDTETIPEETTPLGAPTPDPGDPEEIIEEPIPLGVPNLPYTGGMMEIEWLLMTLGATSFGAGLKLRNRKND